LSFTRASKDASEVRIDVVIDAIDYSRFTSQAIEIGRLALVLDGSIHPDFSSKARYFIERLTQIDKDLEQLAASAKALIAESRHHTTRQSIIRDTHEPATSLNGLDTRPFSDGRRFD
jgi:hypothetical protein